MKKFLLEAHEAVIYLIGGGVRDVGMFLERKDAIKALETETATYPQRDIISTIVRPVKREYFVYENFNDWEKKYKALE